MSKEIEPGPSPSDPLIYQIRIKGSLGDEWTDWFDGLIITLGENGDTLLTGPVADQAALYGLLKRVRDLGMPLVSVSSVEPGPSTALGTGPSTALGTGPSTALGTGPSTALATGQSGAAELKPSDPK